MRRRPWIAQALAGACLIFAGGMSSAQAELRLELDSSTVPANALPALTRWAEETRLRLPPKMRARLDFPVKLRFRRLGTLGRGPDRDLPECREAQSPDASVEPAKDLFVLARTDGSRRIEIHSGLIPEILAGEAGARPSPCAHGNFYRQATAALLHEIGHIYDFASIHAEPLARLQEDCLFSSEHTNPACAAAAQRRYSISTEPAFLSLAGWMNRGFILKTRSESGFAHRNPGKYERTSPQEFFGVNLEYFLLDPEYGCRRPGLYEYLSRELEWAPFPDRPCKVGTQAITVSADPSEGLATLTRLDPSRIYAVHYLLAGSGEDFSSRWGHAMFRIITCAPHRAVPGPECLQDVSHHWVLSFRAAITDLNLDFWKALSGDYTARPFLLTLKSVREEYTRTELREVFSFPMKLTREEITRFVYQMLEFQWSYEDGYNFFTNNCATVSLEFLKSVVQREEMNSLYATTPKGVASALRSIGLLDESVFTDLNVAQEKGFYFPPETARLELALQVAFPKEARPALKDYIYRTVPARRQALHQTHASNNKRASAAFYLLESAIQRLKAKELEQKLAALLIESEQGQALARKYMESANQIAKSTSSVQGYGIPSDERARELIQSLGTVNQTDKATVEKLSQDFTAGLVSELEELNAIQANLKRFRDGAK